MSEYDKLTAGQQATALRLGYDPIYQDYPTREDARVVLDAVTSYPGQTTTQINAAFYAWKNSCIITDVRGMENE